MRKTMNLWVLIALSVCAIVGFVYYSSTLSKSLAELQDVYKEGQVRLGELESEQQQLKSTLETVSTDAFIENQARTVYGYMMKDEIRFVITNPEVLYGDEEVPSR